MTSYIVRRLFYLVPVIILVAAVTFFLMRNAPGGPWDRDLEARQVDANTQKLLNERFGLDKPMWRQFVAYVIGDFDKKGQFVCGFMCGNMGPSYRVRGRQVEDILFEAPENKTALQSRFGYSAQLGLLALSIAIFVGVPVGVIAALRQNSWVDYVSLFVATAGISVPSFVVAIFLIIIFASWLHLINVIPKSWDDLRAWILPALVLGFGTLAFTARLMRASMLEVLRQDYVRTAPPRACGSGSSSPGT